LILSYQAFSSTKSGGWILCYNSVLEST
jgi:hypothetical protein